ncbi:hypothetical protein [Streptomyces sp. NPDC006638]|uniref:hypothetical protein n=1 Tax=unclassified Streptomyces TaxID=2593676 RepID=UPI0033BAEEA3
MALSPRFALNSIGLIAGAFVAVVAMAFTASVAGWIGFGVFTGIAVLGIVGAVFARKAAAKAGHGLLAAVALWSLIASLIFSGSALTWLVFAGGVALVAVALGDLFAHELRTERVVHSLEVRRPAENMTDTAPARSSHIAA